MDASPHATFVGRWRARLDTLGRRPAGRPTRKPPEIDYGADEIPPPAVCLLSALQQAGNVAVSLVIPLVICTEAGIGPATTAGIISVSFLGLALAAVLQSLPRGPVGSGFLALGNFSSLFIAPSAAALAQGGLPLLYGMTVFAGLLEAALAGLLRYVRPFFPPEIAGIVTFLLGIGSGLVGLREVLALHAAGPVPPAHWAVVGLTLATVVGLNVWTRGLVRMSCVLIGMVVGYLAALATGLVDVGRLAAGGVGVVGWPRLGVPRLAFDETLLVPFAVVALAATVKTMAVITTCQRSNDAGWLRADLDSIRRGVLADGLIMVLSGLLGTAAISSTPSSAGLAVATGVTSRRVALVTAALLLPLAFVPMAALLFCSIPDAVAGTILMFTSCFVITSGVEMIASRLLDSRRMLVIAAAILSAEGSESFPAYITALPGWAQTVVASPLLLGVVVALGLNVMFRIGIHRSSLLEVDPAAVDSESVHHFLAAQGAAWGARSDVIQRAAYALAELVETLARSCEVQGPIRIEARFDEFRLDLRASYQGALLPLPGTRPSFDDIATSDDGLLRLSGFMIRSHADAARASRQDAASMVELHFDH